MDSTARITLLYLCVSCFIFHVDCEANGLVLDPLSPDGLLVENLGTVRATAGLWRVWVTLDLPTIPPVLAKDIANLRTFVSQVNHTLWRQAWERRLEAIDSNLLFFPPSTVTSSRPKRGWFDPLGYVIHKVFGLATDNEVSEIKNVLSSLNNDDRVIVNRIDMLTTIVNRSRDFIQENRAALVTQSTRLVILRAVLARMDNAISLNGALLHTEQIFEDIEHRVATIARLFVLYAHRRQDLHSGRLTEELLPTTVLGQILASATSYDMVSLPSLHWYYEHTSVKPMWASSGFLVFEVTLPLVKPTVFLLYRLRSWPVPVTYNSAAKLLAEGMYGSDTTTGSIFKATSCRGHDPVVCKTGPLWNTESFTCIRGILQSGRNLGSCSLSIQFRNLTTISHVSVNSYVISTWGEDIVVRCQGKAAVQSRLKKGVHIARIAQKCSVENARWTLTAIATHSMNLSLTTKPVDRSSALNLSYLMPPLMVNLLKERSVNDLADVPSISLDQLQVPLRTNIDWKSKLSIWNILTLVLLSCIVVTVAALLACRYRQRCMQMIGPWWANVIGRPSRPPRPMKLSPLSKTYQRTDRGNVKYANIPGSPLPLPSTPASVRYSNIQGSPLPLPSTPASVRYSNIQGSPLPATPAGSPPPVPRRGESYGQGFDNIYPRLFPSPNEPFPELALTMSNEKHALTDDQQTSVSTYSLLDAGTYSKMFDPSKYALFPPTKRPSRIYVSDSDEQANLTMLAEAAVMPEKVTSGRQPDASRDVAFQELLSRISSKPSVNRPPTGSEANINLASVTFPGANPK